MSDRADTRRPDLESAILGLETGDEPGFRALEAEIAEFQRLYNPVVRAFGDAGRFLPIAAFRMARVATFGPDRAEQIFRSSGTVGSVRSEHAIRSMEFYGRVVEAGFERVFGPDPGMLVAYLPRYASDSSLVAMTLHLVRRFGRVGSAVFSDDVDRFSNLLREAGDRGEPALVIGAAFGLLDLAEDDRVTISGDVRIIETGGMKTHRRSMDRIALHEALSSGLGCSPEQIGGEFGMCELMSQAWTAAGWWYEPPPWMRIAIVDPEDPDRELPDGSPGLLAVTDLANLYTASHLLTEDRAVARSGRFSVLGRASGAELRGCNFLMEGIP